MTEHINQSLSGKKYLILTYGCQMNERDSEVLEGYLENLGYCPASAEKDADIIILNTCCVREKAELKVFGKLGELSKLKKEKPELIIGICGCMTQQDEVYERIRDKAPYVNLVFGTYNVHQLPNLLLKIQNTDEPAYEIWEKEGDIVENNVSRRIDRIKAYVNISYGCDNFCTYCIVPHVRGRERSRTPDKIVEEISGLVKEGYKEIMLLGQNVNSYGKDLNSNLDFADLLVEVNKIDGLERIRYMTSHPRDFTDKLVETIARCKKVCEHYHLPVQAGSNKILKAMNRGYTREEYLDLVEKIQSISPNYSITSDIIVGFPGEGEEDFKDTLDIVERVRFDAAYTFAYSPRRGTPAAAMECQIKDEEKKERLHRLMEVQNKISLEKNMKLVGTNMEVLVESPSKTDSSRLTGRTRTNKIVNFSGEQSLIGTIINVKITKAQTWNLIGEL
ncbi:tRNA (N6-isopentenyl adenosine(37)-C2)-methylthiotransferase MiaB [Desulfitibacter alkalitolerans]|uniref:tRNA (N6-isopentenyl adenosine(37)-C2)-methylthiotransferase MiaB n=1 Tax=Desulfitibacter alkalitolerans TaxID=264641 RepID=UPI0005588D0C|nr:tRNA (N6-isopentenyl adenosine(37)-C2)-methylthiotransferase MiaB [Desulfitibacter alkalitolerans]